MVNPPHHHHHPGECTGGGAAVCTRSWCTLVNYVRRAPQRQIMLGVSQHFELLVYKSEKAE